MKTTWFVAALVVGSLVGCSDKGDDSGDGGGDLVGDATAGATVYSSSCASCHGDDGTGVTAPSLFDVVPGLTDDGLTDVIQNGTDSMPAIGTSGQDLADLLAYLRATFDA
jgi:cytochrome c551